MKFLKVLIAIVVIIPTLLVAALYGISTSVNLADYREQIQSFVSNKSGMNVVFEGEMDVKILPHPKFSVETLRVDAFRGSKPLFVANNVNVETTLDDYLSFGLGLKKVSMDNPEIYLYTNHKGEANWEKKRSKRKTSAKVDLSFLKRVGQISISNASITMENDALGQQYALNEAQISIDGVDMSRVGVQISALLNEKAVDINSIVNLNSAEGFELEFKTDDNVISLNGDLINPLSSPEFKGDIIVQGETLFTSVYDILRFSPEQRSFNQPINLISKAQLSSKKVAFSEMDLFVGASGKGLKTNGSISVENEKKKQVVRADLSLADTLDLNALGLCKNEEAKNTPFKGWSDERVDLSILEAFESTVKLSVPTGISCNNISFDTAELNFVSTKNALELTSINLTKGEGSVTGNAKLAGNRSYKGMVGLIFDNLPIDDVMGGDFGKRFNAPVSGYVNQKFSGASVEQWVASVNGDINLTSESIGTNGLEAGSLVSVVRYLTGASKVAPAGRYQEGSFELKAQTAKGVMRVEALSMAMPSLSITGAGKVDLNRMAMHMRVTPTASKLLDLSLPVLVKGSVAKPKIMPDPTSIRNQATAVGAAVGGPVGALVGGVVGDVLLEGELGEGEQKQQVSEEIDPSKKRLLNFLKGQLEK